jgi:hypothetical protein
MKTHHPSLDIGICFSSIFTLCVLCTAVLCFACASQAGGDNESDSPPEPVKAGNFTYRLSESTGSLALWTAPVAHRVQSFERAPDTEQSGLSVFAAKNEFEPVQLLVGPAPGAFRVSVDPFAELGATQRIDVTVGSYESGWVEHLTPTAASDDVLLSEEFSVPVWITLYVPSDATAGEHKTWVRLASSAGEIAVPLTLTVFDFALPDAVHFDSQLNLDVSSLIPEGGTVDDAKALLLDHRLTPASVTWPSGFNWSITWDNPSADRQCESFWDEPTEPDEYSIGYLSKRYILGEGWRGEGFPDSEIFQFVDNSTPRPETFCGISRGDHYGTDAYNAEWSQYLSALEAYLTDNGMIDKVYYYVQNEPQDQADDDLAAFLCRLTKAAAPNLRIAVSEQPKPEIAENSNGGCGYDIWIAYVRHYQQTYAWQRQRDFGEEVWFYSLDQDPDPYFNPTRFDVEGMHHRIIPWVAWTERIRGWAYYDGGRFFDGPNPRVSAELLREGFEDYEYLYLANGGAHPVVFEDNPVDQTVRSVASSLTSWTKDADAMATLRRELGRYIDGSRDTLPVIEVESSRPRGAYYINFQDPNGEPTDDPLVIDGNTYMKIGWAAYDADAGYGWYGENINDPGIALYGYDDVEGYTEAQKSYLYDDYGRDNLFEFDLENGAYTVTIGVGRPAHGYADPHNATIEGVEAVHEQPTTDDAPCIDATVEVNITDGRLSVETGGLSESTGEWSYTFVAYLMIEPVEK